MVYRVCDIAEALGARFEGLGDLTVVAAAEPALAGENDLALAMDARHAAGLARGKARVAVLSEGADWQAMGLHAAIFVGRPRFAMSGLTQFFDRGRDFAPGIHPSALIAPSARIAGDASIGPFAVIGDDVEIGPQARIGAHVSIGAGARLGASALVMDGVRIGARVTIGARFIGQPNCVIGSDGFSFVTEERARVEEARATLGKVGDSTPDGAGAKPWLRIHSLGSVQIGDDVEVGATCTIDRGTMRDTVIGRGTKLDNQVHVGHNVVVGEDCLLCGQVGIAGSTRIGNRVVLGGQVGVADNIVVGDDVVAGGAAKLMSNVAAGKMMMGPPSVRMDQQVEIYKAQRRLPRMMAQLAELQETVKTLLDTGKGQAS